jgi:hypothetical protein
MDFAALMAGRTQTLSDKEAWTCQILAGLMQDFADALGPEAAITAGLLRHAVAYRQCAARRAGLPANQGRPELRLVPSLDDQAG